MDKAVSCIAIWASEAIKHTKQIPQVASYTKINTANTIYFFCGLRRPMARIGDCGSPDGCSIPPGGLLIY